MHGHSRTRRFLRIGFTLCIAAALAGCDATEEDADSGDSAFSLSGKVDVTVKDLQIRFADRKKKPVPGARASLALLYLTKGSLLTEGSFKLLGESACASGPDGVCRIPEKRYKTSDGDAERDTGYGGFGVYLGPNVDGETSIDPKANPVQVAGFEKCGVPQSRYLRFVQEGNEKADCDQTTEIFGEHLSEKVEKFHDLACIVLGHREGTEIPLADAIEDWKKDCSAQSK